MMSFWKSRVEVLFSSFICCWTYGSSERVETVTLTVGGEDSPSFRKISSLIVFLVISLKMFLSVQTGQPGLDFFAMFIPDTKIVLEAIMTRTVFLRGHILESELSQYQCKC